MLERAAGCFETAGRRLLKDSQGAIRSQRSLSEHFWKHNTAEGDVARWFLALIQSPASLPLTVLRPSHGKSPLNNVNLPFLDFLYPPNTRNTNASRNCRHSKRPVSRRRRKGPASFRRTFTSVASSLDHKSPEEAQDEESISSEANPIVHKQESVASFQESLASRTDDGFDKAWVTYISMGRPPEVRSDFCAYLSRSKKPVNQKHAWEVFQEIPPKHRTEADFRHICQSQISSIKTYRMAQIFEQAHAVGVAVDFCFELSFKYYLQRRQWAKMRKIWALRCEGSPLLSRKTLSDIYYPRLPEDLLSLLRGIEGTADLPASSRDHLLAIAKFLFKRVISTVDARESKPVDVLLNTFVLLDKLGILSDSHYEEVINGLQDANSRLTFARSVLFYSQMRSLRPNSKPKKTFLMRQIQTMAEFDMTSSIVSFLDEWALFFEKPSPEAYKVTLNAFARVGNVNEVHRLFDRYVSDYGKPKSRRFILPLLAVHACDGNVADTWKQFDRIKAEFDLEPNTSCWNILLQAYSGMRDVTGAFATFARMEAAQIEPNPSTFEVLMGMLANRGDIDGVRRLLKLAEDRKVEITMPVMGKVVSAYLNNNRIDLAEQLAIACLDMEVQGSPSSLLNSLLMKHVFRIDHRGYYRVLGIMHKAGIPHDARTHLAGIIRLSLMQRPRKALSKLRKCHKQGALHANEIHFVIIMLAYINCREYEQARIIMRELLQRFPDSAMYTSLKKALQIHATKEPYSEDEKPLQLYAEDFFLGSFIGHSLVSLFSQLTDIAAFGGGRSLGHRHFSKLVDVYLTHYYRHFLKKESEFDRSAEAEELYSHFLSNRSVTVPSEKVKETVSLRILQPKMVAHMKAGDYDKVDECWETGFSNAVDLARPLDVDSLMKMGQSIASPNSSPSKSTAVGDMELEVPENDALGALANPDAGSVAQETPEDIISSRRFILSRLLNTYLLSIGQRGDTSMLKDIVDKVKAAGFALSSSNRSTIIQIMSESEAFADLTIAFKNFEKYFMPNFVSWRHTIGGLVLKPPGAPRSLYTLEDPRLPEHSKLMLGKAARHYWGETEPGFMQPSYLTMVCLAAAMKRLRTKVILDGGSEIQDLYQLAPSTLDALGTMPYLPDKFQGIYLRGHAPKDNRQPQARKYPVRPGGILSRGSTLRKRRPVYPPESPKAKAADGSQSEVKTLETTGHEGTDLGDSKPEEMPESDEDPDSVPSESMEEWLTMAGLDAADRQFENMPLADDFDQARLGLPEDTISEDWEKFLNIEDRADVKNRIFKERWYIKMKKHQKRRRKIPRRKFKKATNRFKLPSSNGTS